MQGNSFLLRHVLPSVTLFAKLKQGQHTLPPLVGTALAPRIQEPKIFCRRRGWASTPAGSSKMLLRDFRRICRTRRPTESREKLQMAFGFGPDLVLSIDAPCITRGTATLNDISFTTKSKTISGGDTAADDSRPLNVYCDACIARFGAALKQV